MLHQLDFCLQRAGGLDGLQDGDHVTRADTQGVQAFNQILQADALRDHGHFITLAGVNLNVAAWNHGGGALLREGLRL